MQPIEEKERTKNQRDYLRVKHVWFICKNLCPGNISDERSIMKEGRKIKEEENLEQNERVKQIIHVN